jgi:phospholipid/cholesterol/gamma-HCH transport system substrate-binding protein
MAAAAGFLTYALSEAGGGRGGRGYELSARFGQVGALAPGADVRVAGVKVGSVSAIALDPKTYQAVARMTIDPKVRLPADSTVKVTSDSLLGGQHLSVEPGGAVENLKAGGEFQNTQGAVDIFGLIGQVLRPQTSAGATAGAPGGPGGSGPAAATAP